MATQIGSSGTLSHEKKADTKPLYEMPNVNVQGTSMFSKRQFLKWFGRASTIILILAAIFPDTLSVPLNWRPWVFLTSIFWVFAFCTGFFNS
jgi:hypothetical protein